MQIGKKLMAIGLLAAFVLANVGCAGPVEPTYDRETMATVPEQENEMKMMPLVYPDEALKDLSANESVVKAFCARAAQDASYTGNCHYSGTNLAVSPYYTAKVENTVLPVYATPVYVADGSYGTLHSFASVDVELKEGSAITVQLLLDGRIRANTVQLFSHSPGEMNFKDGLITLKIRAHGVYTLVINDGQDYAISLFIRQYQDEDARIAAYRDQYGADNVTVFEPGLHEIDYLHMESNSVLYLKSGAVLLPKHTFDIQSDADAASAEEPNAQQSNGIGLNRFPVVNGYAGENMVIAGRGTVDMTQLDWHERRGIVFTLCENITVDGVIFINPCEWAFITYRCENVSVTQSAVLGYRTNSDAFAICNSINVEVTSSFARTGDDMFEVKTLGGVESAVSRDITFRNCQAWGSKARCFGVIGEIEKDVSNILFENGIVIFRDATWDNNRIGSLVVLRETGNGTVNGVTFRNISIHYDKGRAIQVGVYSPDLENGKMENIVFENIDYCAGMNAQIRLNRGAGNAISVTIRNVTANGTKLTAKNVDEFIYCDRDGLVHVK